MTPLRQRMLHELQRRNYSPCTIRGYLGAVSQFAEYFRRSPEQLGPDHLRRYQRYLLQERKLAPSSVELRISALRFLYKRTLKRKDLAFDDLIFPKVPHKLPTVLSQEEVVLTFYVQVEFPACLCNITAEVAGSRPVVPATTPKKIKVLWQVPKS
jgi:integrase/recombinase XerD